MNIADPICLPWAHLSAFGANTSSLHDWLVLSAKCVFLVASSMETLIVLILKYIIIETYNTYTSMMNCVTSGPPTY